jgi:hypothetical protein
MKVYVPGANVSVVVRTDIGGVETSSGRSPWTGSVPVR